VESAKNDLIGNMVIYTLLLKLLKLFNHVGTFWKAVMWMTMTVNK